MDEGEKALAKIEAHELLCAALSAAINARLKRIEGWIFAGVVSTLGLTVTLLLKSKGLL